jgi:hypothetical protein
VVLFCVFLIISDQSSSLCVYWLFACFLKEISVFILFYCTGWRNIVALTKFLTTYQIYHSWIHPLLVLWSFLIGLHEVFVCCWALGIFSYILDISSISNVCFANIFTHFMDCLFTLLIVSFDMQNFANLM